MRVATPLALVALLGCTEQASEERTPPPPDAGPVVDAVPDLAPADVALPRFVIVPGAVQIEVEHVPDAAAEPPKPVRRGRKARRKPRPPTVSRPAQAVSAMSTIRAHWGEVERCYGDIALKDPTVQGRIVMQWTLGKDGMPTATAVLKDTLRDKRVSQCIKKRARAWRFPAPSGGVSVVTYPFDLRVQ